MNSLHLSPESPVRAVFTVTDDAMLPYIRPGEALALAFELPREGEVGLFQLDGETLLRQYIEDCFGTVYLLAADRSRPELDRTIPAGAGPVLCLGRILLEEQPPRPLR